jgi:hypothetical protein
MTKKSDVPDLGSCRKRKINNAVFECKTEHAKLCPFVIHFGGYCYCNHPNREEINE